MILTVGIILILTVGIISILIGKSILTVGIILILSEPVVLILVLEIVLYLIGEIVLRIETRWVGSSPQLFLQYEDRQGQVDSITGAVAVSELKLFPLFPGPAVSVL